MILKSSVEKTSIECQDTVHQRWLCWQTHNKSRTENWCQPEMSIEPDLHWTAVDPDYCKFCWIWIGSRLLNSSKLWSGPDLGLVNGKEMGHFCCGKADFSNIWLHLNLDFPFETIFGLCLDLDWVLKKIRIGSGSQNMTVRSALVSTCVMILTFLIALLNSLILIQIQAL